MTTSPEKSCERLWSSNFLSSLKLQTSYFFTDEWWYSVLIQGIFLQPSEHLSGSSLTQDELLHPHTHSLPPLPHLKDELSTLLASRSQAQPCLWPVVVPLYLHLCRKMGTQTGFCRLGEGGWWHTVPATVKEHILTLQHTRGTAFTEDQLPCIHPRFKLCVLAGTAVVWHAGTYNSAHFAVILETSPLLSTTQR